MLHFKARTSPGGGGGGGKEEKGQRGCTGKLGKSLFRCLFGEKRADAFAALVADPADLVFVCARGSWIMFGARRLLMQWR